MAVPSLLTPASSLNVGSQFDASQLDNNLQQIRTVERTWQLPALPDQTRLDLAMQSGQSPDAISSFLQGTAQDLAAVDNPLQDGSDQGGYVGMPGFDQAKVILAGLSGEPAPKQYTADAVQLIKRRAVEQGYLKPDAVDDSNVWYPELNGIRSQMAFDDYNSRQRGDRPGAMPLKSVMGLIGDFTSPTGLLSAATKLDLFWDFGAVSKEFSSWGDKWRKVGKSKNPLDFAKNLVDAVTGPVDDIVLPIINVGLLFAGIGEIENTARIAWMGERALTGGGAVEGLYQGARSALGFGRVGEGFLSAASTARNFEQLGEASWMANRLQKGGAVASKLGDTMAAWRDATAVKGVKGLIQPAMRLGFAQQIESRLPTYQSNGASLGDVPIIGQAAQGLQSISMNPLAMPIEMLVAPYNIWKPGTFFKAGGDGANVLSHLYHGSGALLGTVGGRAGVGAVLGAVGGVVVGNDAGDIAKGAVLGATAAAAAPLAGRALGESRVARSLAAGAVGAGAGALLGQSPGDALMGGIAGVGLIAIPGTVRSQFPGLGGGAIEHALQKVGEGMSYLSFKPLANDQRLTNAFHQGMLTYLQDQPERLGQYLATARSTGVTAAVAELHGVDEETAAAMMGFVSVSAAFDHTASVQAQAFGGSKDAYHTFRNKLVNQVRMMPTPADANAYTPAALDEIAMAAAYTSNSNRRGIIKAFRQIRADLEADPGKAFEMAAAHNEKAVDTMRQLMSAENMPDFDQNLIGSYGNLSDQERSLVLQEYLPQVGDTFGNFGKYAGITSELRQLNGSGLLDGMSYAGAKNARGFNVIPVKQDVLAGAVATNAGTVTTNKSIIDILLGSDRVDVDRARRLGRFTPLARSTDVGRPTVMLQDTYDKQQLLEIADKWDDILQTDRALKNLPRDLTTRALPHAQAIGLDATDNIGQWSRGQVKNLVAQMKGVDRKRWGAVLDFARRRGLSLDDVAAEVARNADEIVGDSEHLQALGIKPLARGSDGRALTGISALEAHTKALSESAKYRAGRIDVDQLREYVRGRHAPEEADRMDAFLNGLDRDGYKLVHGTEFLMPEDLVNGPMFSDIGARHLNAVSLGNFFRGKLPVEARALADRRRRLAIADELSNIGVDVHPGDQRVGWAVSDLYKVLRQYQDETSNLVQDLHNQSFFERTLNRAKSSFTPFSLEQLTQKQKRVEDVLRAGGWSPEEANAIWKATAKFRASDFQDVGLYALEAKLRSSNQAAWFLKTLSGSKHFEGLNEDAGQLQKLWLAGKGKRYAGAALGAAVGGYEGDPNDSFEQRLGKAVLGAAGGAAAASVVPRALGVAGVDRLARAAEASRYGYLADNLARVRDSMRFTLNPFFDISRYTEGLTLAQTAGPLRTAEGKRLVLPLDMSPTGLRRQIAKGLRQDGMGTLEARDAARGSYDRWLSEFQSAARGDFDPDALDSVGQWFRQYGIMGFSPTDWMATAYAHLRQAGLGNEKAYEAARHMYTYGTTGRSAAELSTNFIFFPFSFQKKALTHIANWMNDDLGRSIMIHDAWKTYEILDERYDLDNYWREHAPALQMLNKLNLFAFGISPGRFGGINRQFFESGGKLAWNMFTPAAMHIKDVTAANELTDTMHSLLPVFNDINWMTQEVKDQGHVLFSPTHVSTATEVGQGYDAWNTFKKQFGSQLEAQGFKFSDLNQNWAADLKAYYDGQKAKLAEQYPAWQASKVESIQNIDALNAEKSLRLGRATLAATNGQIPGRDDFDLMAMENFVDQQISDLSLLGITDPQDYPSQVNDAIRQKAIQMQAENPSFRGLWKKFYEKTWGPISVPQLPGYLQGV